MRTNQTVADFLQINGVKFATTFTGKRHSESWGGHCFCYVVEFTRSGKREPLRTDYHMGLAHVDRFKKPKPPSPASVLYSLFLDASATDQSFSDWCADSGMDDDSIKAFDTYRQCCAISRQFRAFFTHAECEALQEMLQDY